MRTDLTALLPVADGSEDLETVTLIDVLRRADIAVTVASVMLTPQIVGSRGTRIIADQLIADCTGQAWDLIVLPGGLPGADHLAANPILVNLIQTQLTENRMLAAICAAPARVLAAHAVLRGRKATCYPGFECAFPDVDWQRDDVVIDDHIVTSRGPGTALAFALCLVERLRGMEIRQQIAAQMLFA